jgi:hypothetical protein
MGRRACKGMRVLVCRSIEPEQSLGSCQMDVIVVGIDVIEGSPGHGGSSDR